ncbi:MAG: hypothetical protein G01um101444_370, partial [Parcubacteria group bacterium Gr01-1014_44]
MFSKRDLGLLGFLGVTALFLIFGAHGLADGKLHVYFLDV